MKTGLGQIPFLFLIVSALIFGGCLELIRKRPDDDEGKREETVRAKGRKEESSEKSTERTEGDTGDKESHRTRFPSAEIVSPSGDTLATKMVEPEGEIQQTIAARVEAEDKKMNAVLYSVDPSKKRSAKEINKYSFWCIDQEMWSEAKAHLEKAAKLDTTSASIYNNLGIVYEYFQMEHEARRAYQTAMRLDSRNVVYRRNYILLKRSIGSKVADEPMIEEESLATEQPEQ